RKCIIGVGSNWVDSDASESDIIFYLTAESFENVKFNRVWSKTNPQERAVQYLFANGDTNPKFAAQAIAHWAKGPYNVS
ncbi:MAG: hypothetical protein JWM11_5189, partial [Planctomycetaceae bacterium]|nr:hypothetical protein [Planctomycetaceae bacterium]